MAAVAYIYLSMTHENFIFIKAQAHIHTHISYAYDYGFRLTQPRLMLLGCVCVEAFEFLLAYFMAAQVLRVSNVADYWGFYICKYVGVCVKTLVFCMLIARFQLSYIAAKNDVKKSQTTQNDTTELAVSCCFANFVA